VFVISGKVGFLGRMYAFGAMLSFTIAHASVIALRVKKPDRELPWRARPNLTIRGVSWPLFAIAGGLGTGIAWFVVIAKDGPTRYAGLAWLAVGFVFYPLYRRHLHEPLATTVRAPVVLGPATALEYRNILVPVAPGRETEEALDVACRLATERRARVVAIAVVEVPLELPLDAEMPEAERGANELLDAARTVGDSYGVDVIGRLARDRRAGRAIVREAEQRNTEIVVMGSSRRTQPRAAIFGGTTDYVLKHAPCRVMVVGARVAA
jgi:APA family basic amino acid/polyamine antiporter